MKSMGLLLGAGLSAFLLATSWGEERSNQVVVTFDVPPVPRYGLSFLPNYSEQGLLFWQNSIYSIKRQGPLLSDAPQNGTTIMIWDTPQGPIAFSHTNDFTFGLYSVDLAEDNRTVIPDVYYSLEPVTIYMRGYKSDGTVLDTSFTTDGWSDGIGPGADFETFYFDELWATDLVKAEFRNWGSLDLYAMDNLVLINVVPEPEIMTLMALGGAILAAWRWRQA